MTISTNKTTRVNEKIIAHTVLLIDADGNQVGLMPVKDALRQAAEASLDLVEIAGSAGAGKPPVCKIMDYGKFLFDKKKKSKKKQVQMQVKELKFRPGTEEGDLQVKIKKLREFLEKGHKVKISLRFRGREMMHQDLSRELFERLQKEIEGAGVIEQSAMMEGKQMIMVIGPKKHGV